MRAVGAVALGLGLAACVSSAELVDITKEASITVDSDGTRWGQGVAALTDGQSDTRWHQADDGKWSVAIEAYWPGFNGDGYRLNDIDQVALTTSFHSNYAPRKVTLEFTVHDGKVLKREYRTDKCMGNHKYTYNVDMDKVRKLRIILDGHCGGSHFAFTELEIKQKKKYTIGFVGRVTEAAGASGTAQVFVAVCGLATIIGLAAAVATCSTRKALANDDEFMAHP